MKTLTNATAMVSVSIALAAPAMAAHNNPWATAEDVVRQQFHDGNQVQRIDTPGQDEMRGVMNREARGKLEGRGSQGQGRGPNGG